MNKQTSRVFFKYFVYLREIERVCVSGREGQRQRENVPLTPHEQGAGPRAGCRDPKMVT